MAYAATADKSLSRVAAPGVLALQRALVWLVGASGAIVFIEPSPYELVTLLAAVVVLCHRPAAAAGVHAAAAADRCPQCRLQHRRAFPCSTTPPSCSWIATSWYMAVTVIFSRHGDVGGHRPRGSTCYAAA